MYGMVHHVCLVRMVVRLQVVQRPVRPDHVRALVARTVETRVNSVLCRIHGTVVPVNLVVHTLLLVQVDPQVARLNHVIVVSSRHMTELLGVLRVICVKPDLHT